MSSIGESFQTADWQNEKHVPVIDCPDSVGAGEPFAVEIAIGKEIAHPNTTEHHIRWIQLYFRPEGGTSVYQVGYYEFAGHGESPQGANQGPVYTHHGVTTTVSLNTPGTLIATSLCNIHGLWESSKEISVG